MNSNEMFDAIDKATRLNLRDRAAKAPTLPNCNVADLLISIFSHSMDADGLIKALESAEKELWAARRAADLRRDYELDNPSDVTAWRM
jgi:hypothetical protein